jgi:hypothetical protein
LIKEGDAMLIIQAVLIEIQTDLLLLACWKKKVSDYKIRLFRKLYFVSIWHSF